MTGSFSPAILSELAKYDTPTICNVIELFDVRPRHTGYMNQSIRCCFPQLAPMVGFALTSSFRSLSPPTDGDVYASLDRQIESFAALPGPPVVVFQDVDEPTAAATFGEVMCTTYQAFGATGLVTSGAGRDLDQVEAIEFPVFTGGTICSHGYCHILSVGATVVVGGTTISNGDLLHGDRNGVTTVPAEIASAIPDACKELMAAEDIVLNCCRNGDVTPRGLTDARKECADVVARLGERLRGT